MTATVDDVEKNATGGTAKTAVVAIDVVRL
jgi:hypothetical protein